MSKKNLPVKAAGTSDGAKKGVATTKSTAAQAASMAAHTASIAAHESGTDEDHNAAKDAHEAASTAHSAAMIAQAKAGNTEAATDHAKAMAAHDACADGHDCQDEDAVQASSQVLNDLIVKAGGPGSGRKPEVAMEHDVEADKHYANASSNKSPYWKSGAAHEASSTALNTNYGSDHYKAAVAHKLASEAWKNTDKEQSELHSKLYDTHAQFANKAPGPNFGAKGYNVLKTSDSTSTKANNMKTTDFIRAEAQDGDPCPPEGCPKPPAPKAIAKESDQSQMATKKAMLKTKIAQATEEAHPDGEAHGTKQSAHYNAADAHREAAYHASAGPVKDYHTEAADYHNACASDHQKVVAEDSETGVSVVKAGGPGSGRKSEGAQKNYNALDKEAMAKTNDARNATDKAKFSGQEEDHIAAAGKHAEASQAHEDAAKAARDIGNEKAYTAHHDYAESHFASQNDHKTAFTSASGMESTLGIVRCQMSTTEFDSALPTSEFMWMPAGKHTIQASYDDKPARVTVVCDPEKTTSTVKAAFARISANAQGRPPFGDINHKEVEAAFWPKDFVAHEDGVYCQAEWTELGLKCVRGKTFRSFSPCFSCDADWVKAVDNGSGVLVFPEGVRGSASNPAKVTGVSNKSVGSLTNWPAFKAILPVKASQADPKPETNNSDKTKEPTKMKIKFIKASACGKFAAGTEHDLTDELAKPFIQAGEAAVPDIANLVIKAQEERVRQSANDVTLVDRAIVRAVERGALPKGKEAGKNSPEADSALVKAKSYLANGVPVCDVVEIIDTMPAVKATEKGNGALFTRQTSGTEAGGIVKGSESVEEVCQGILKAYEPMVGMVNGSPGLVKAGRMDEAILASRKIANLFKSGIMTVLEKGGDFILSDMVKAADTQDPNGQLGTIATGILLMRDLGFLKAKLVPLTMATTDLSAEPVKFGQQIITRYKTPPNVLTWKKGIGYTNASTDTVRTVSTPSTTDVPINMQQNKAVCVQFDNQLLGSTMRNLFGEQQPMEFYALAQAINLHYISVLIASQWTPKTLGGMAGGQPLNPPKFNASGWNIPSLVTVKNKLTLAQVPDEGRKVLLHSFFHDILLQDSNLLTAYVIKAALQQQTNKDITNFAQTDLPELFGLDIIESQLFSDVPYVDGGWQPNTFGFAGIQSSSLFVSRIPNDYNTSQPDIPATAAIQIVTEPDSNLSMVFSRWVDNAAKVTNAEVALMYQAAQGDPRTGFLLNTVGGAQN